MESVPQTKRCVRCAEEKPLSEFGMVRGVRAGTCKECRKVICARYADANREKVKESKQRYADANQEKVREGKRKAASAWRLANIDQHSANLKAWRETHKEYIRAYERRIYAADPEGSRAHRYNTSHRELLRERRRRYYAGNKSKVLALQHRHDARRRGNGGSYTAGEWEALKANYGYRCLACGRSEPAIRLTVDHVIPVSKGGVNSIANIQPLCRSCNSRKRAKVTDYRPRD